jgi:acetyltransferase
VPVQRGNGLEALLLNKIVAYCKSRGMAELFGTIRKDNQSALCLARKAGWELADTADPAFVEARLKLQQQRLNRAHP